MPRRSKKSSSASSAVDTPVENTVTETVTATATEEVATEQSLTDAFNELLTQLTAFRSQITTLSAQVRTLRSRSEREIKAAQKTAKKRRNANRKPSGFTKPTQITDEMAKFIGIPKGTEIARTDVTKEINKYICEHNLKDPKNGRIIRADSKLRKLLRLNKSDELTYFNIQKYLSPHFPKKTVNAEA